MYSGDIVYKYALHLTTEMDIWLDYYETCYYNNSEPIEITHHTVMEKELPTLTEFLV